MSMDILGIILGIVVLLFTSWGALWYKLGKLTKECANIKVELKELQKQVEHILIHRCCK